MKTAANLKDNLSQVVGECGSNSCCVNKIKNRNMCDGLLKRDCSNVYANLKLRINYNEFLMVFSSGISFTGLKLQNYL